jgi:hypothetical protein
MKTSSGRTADTALPYTTDGGRPTARGANASVGPSQASPLETTGARPFRSSRAGPAKRSQPRPRAAVTTKRMARPGLKPGRQDLQSRAEPLEACARRPLQDRGCRYRGERRGRAARDRRPRPAHAAGRPDGLRLNARSRDRDQLRRHRLPSGRAAAADPVDLPAHLDTRRPGPAAQSPRPLPADFHHPVQGATDVKSRPYRCQHRCLGSDLTPQW